MEIDRAIDSCHVVIAVLTPAAYQSVMCLGEQIRALDKGSPFFLKTDSNWVTRKVYAAGEERLQCILMRRFLSAISASEFFNSHA